jgi:hypothetical protein
MVQLRFRYQPSDLGHRKRPDCVVEPKRGKVLVEVTDFLTGEMDKPVAQLDVRRHPIGGYEDVFVSVATGALDLPAMHQRSGTKSMSSWQSSGRTVGNPCIVVLHKGGRRDHRSRFG